MQWLIYCWENGKGMQWLTYCFENEKGMPWLIYCVWVQNWSVSRKRVCVLFICLFVCVCVCVGGGGGAFVRAFVCASYIIVPVTLFFLSVFSVVFLFWHILSLSLSLCLCLSDSASASVCLSVSVCLSASASVCLSVSVCLSDSASVCLSVSVSLTLPLSVSLSPSVCLSVCVCLSVSLDSGLFLYFCGLWSGVSRFLFCCFCFVSTDTCIERTNKEVYQEYNTATKRNKVKKRREKWEGK